MEMQLLIFNQSPDPLHQDRLNNVPTYFSTESTFKQINLKNKQFSSSNCGADGSLCETAPLGPVFCLSSSNYNAIILLLVSKRGSFVISVRASLHQGCVSLAGPCFTAE